VRAADLLTTPRGRLRALALALLALPLLFAGGARGPAPRVRLFGPFVELAAEVQWLRFRSAALAGRRARALELAEQALALDPGWTAGWQALGATLALDFASEAREPDLPTRRAWFDAGIEALERGAERARSPAELHVFRAVILFGKAEGDPGLDPGGAPALRRRALEAYEAAAALGDAHAAELGRHLRAAAAE